MIVSDMAKRFEYRGDLAVTPLPEILATIHRYRVPGVVRASLQEKQRRIFVDDGRVVFAETNERGASLGAYLLRTGALAPDVAREAAKRVRPGVRLGQVLLELKAVDPETLNASIGAQIREVLWGAFEWPSGDVIFDVGERRADESVKIDLAIPEVVREGIRRAPDPRVLIRRMGYADTILEAIPDPAIAIFTPGERRYHESIDGKTPLRPLCNLGPGDIGANARTLYAFYCLGLLRKREEPAEGRKLRWTTGGGRIA